MPYTCVAFSFQVDGDIPNEYEWPFSLTHVKEVVKSFSSKSGPESSMEKDAASVSGDQVQKKSE